MTFIPLIIGAFKAKIAYFNIFLIYFDVFISYAGMHGPSLSFFKKDALNVEALYFMCL